MFPPMVGPGMSFGQPPIHKPMMKKSETVDFMD